MDSGKDFAIDKQFTMSLTEIFRHITYTRSTVQLYCCPSITSAVTWTSSTCHLNRASDCVLTMKFSARWRSCITDN